MDKTEVFLEVVKKNPLIVEQTDNIREKYLELIKAFTDAGLTPNICVWLHNGCNKDLNLPMSLALTQLISDTQEPKVTVYEHNQNTHAYTHVTGSLHHGDLNITCPNKES